MLAVDDEPPKPLLARSAYGDPIADRGAVPENEVEPFLAGPDHNRSSLQATIYRDRFARICGGSHAKGAGQCKQQRFGETSRASRHSGRRNQPPTWNRTRHFNYPTDFLALEAQAEGEYPGT